MDLWIIWLIAGLLLATLELVVPGGIVIFLGLAAMAVSLGFKLGFFTSVTQGFIAWFVASIVFLFFLRALFLKLFEGDTAEEAEYLSALVEVVEHVFPYREGRVSHRGTTWPARSDEEIPAGAKAVIVGRDGNVWIIKSI
jgi:inner membrane protein